MQTLYSGARIYFIDGSTLDIPKEIADDLKSGFRPEEIKSDSMLNIFASEYFRGMTIMVHAIKYIEWTD